MKKPKLTPHIRHARLVKLVRRTYQKDNPGSKLFNNTSGIGWAGNDPEFKNGTVTLQNYRPLNAGIPSKKEGSGGTDLLGENYYSLCWYLRDDNGKCLFNHNCKECPVNTKHIPILTGIECKTGNAKLKPNQKNFRNWLKSINGIHYLARECSTCWDNWEPIYKKGVIVEWIPVKDCPECGGVGFGLEG
jgi:hypothetical protein